MGKLCEFSQHCAALACLFLTYQRRDICKIYAPCHMNMRTRREIWIWEGILVMKLTTLVGRKETGLMGKIRRLLIKVIYKIIKTTGRNFSGTSWYGTDTVYHQSPGKDPQIFLVLSTLFLKPSVMVIWIPCCKSRPLLFLVLPSAESVLCGFFGFASCWFLVWWW